MLKGPAAPGRLQEPPRARGEVRHERAERRNGGFASLGLLALAPVGGALVLGSWLAQQGEPDSIFQVLAQLLALLAFFGLPALTRSKDKKKRPTPARGKGRTEVERTGKDLWRELLEQAREESKPAEKPKPTPAKRPEPKPDAKPATTREAIDRERQATARPTLAETMSREASGGPGSDRAPRTTPERRQPPQLPEANRPGQRRSAPRGRPERLAPASAELPSNLGSELPSGGRRLPSPERAALGGLAPVLSEEALERGQAGSLGQLGNLRRSVGDEPKPAPGRGAWLPGSGDGWRQAILLTEVLGSPVALRPPGQEPWSR